MTEVRARKRSVRRTQATRPLLSVVLPTFNRIHSVCSAIDSMLLQTFGEFELIVADDGSTDGTVDLLKGKYAREIASEMIRILELGHGGVCAARNAALKAARGEWIAYLDSDNIVSADFLQTFADGIKSHPDAKCFYAALMRKSDKFILDRPFDRQMLLRGNYIDMGVYCHHRDLIKEFGLFDSSVTGVEDWDLIVRHSSKYTPVRLGRVVLSYRDDASDDRLSRNSDIQAAAYERFREKYEPDARPRDVDVEVIRKSWFFDSEWYMAEYGKIIAGADPAVHYLVRGWKNGLCPGPCFDGRQYLAKNPDIAKVLINPLLHYERSGRKEGRVGFLRRKPLPRQTER